MTADKQEPEVSGDSLEEEQGNWRSRVGRAASSARNLAGTARNTAGNAGASTRNMAGNAAESTRRAAGSAKAVTDSASEKIKRPIDIISLAEFRTEFEQFIQAVSTTVIGIHQDQTALSERLDRLEERLARLEQAASGDTT